MQKSFILENESNKTLKTMAHDSNLTNLFTSEIQLHTQLFHQNDYVQLVSCRLRNIHLISGIIQFKGDDLGTFPCEQPVGEINCPEDLMAQLNNNQKQILFIYDFKNKVVEIQNQEQRSEYIIISVTGNLKYLLGIYEEIKIFKDDTLQLSTNNSLKIQFIKLTCEQLNASEESYHINQQGHYIQDFSKQTVCVIYNKDFSYQSRNLDVSMKIIQNAPFIFKILDQDNEEVHISHCILELLLTKNFDNNVSGSVHLKKQTFITLSKDQTYLNNNFSKISIGDIQGKIKLPLFTRESSKIQIFHFNAAQFFNSQNDRTNFYKFQTYDAANTRLSGMFYFYDYKKTLYDYETLYLYDQGEMTEYKDKFIDDKFFEQLNCVFGRLFTGKVQCGIQDETLFIDLIGGVNEFFYIKYDTFDIEVANFDYKNYLDKDGNIQNSDPNLNIQLNDVDTTYCVAFCLHYTLSNILLTHYLHQLLSTTTQDYGIIQLYYGYFDKTGKDVLFDDKGKINYPIITKIVNYKNVFTLPFKPEADKTFENNDDFFVQNINFRTERKNYNYITNPGDELDWQVNINREQLFRNDNLYYIYLEKCESVPLQILYSEEIYLNKTNPNCWIWSNMIEKDQRVFQFNLKQRIEDQNDELYIQDVKDYPLIIIRLLLK